MIFIKNIGPEFFLELHEACKSDGYTPHEYFLPHTSTMSSMSPFYTDQLNDGHYRLIFAGPCNDEIFPGTTPEYMKKRFHTFVEAVCKVFESQAVRSLNSFLHGGQDKERNLVNKHGHAISDYDVLAQNSIKIVHVSECDPNTQLIQELNKQYYMLMDDDKIQVYGGNTRRGKHNTRYFEVIFSGTCLSSKKAESPKIFKLFKIQVEGAEL